MSASTPCRCLHTHTHTHIHTLTHSHTHTHTHKHTDVLTVGATDHVGGMDDVAVQALGDEAAGEGVGQGLASMAAHVPDAGVGKVGGEVAR